MLTLPEHLISPPLMWRICVNPSIFFIWTSDFRPTDLVLFHFPIVYSINYVQLYEVHTLRISVKLEKCLQLLAKIISLVLWIVNVMKIMKNGQKIFLSSQHVFTATQDNPNRSADFALKWQAWTRCVRWGGRRRTIGLTYIPAFYLHSESWLSICGTLSFEV